MIPRVLALVLLAAVAVTGTAGARAGELPAPADPVILTVSGAIGRTNADGKARFDRALLETLGWVEIETFTPWTDGPQRFGGVRLSALLEAVGAEGHSLLARALNDYTAVIPIGDAAEFDVVLALDRNGKPLTVRGRGPVWIVYPARKPWEGEVDRHNDKMVWQLRSLEVR